MTFIHHRNGEYDNCLLSLPMIVPNWCVPPRDLSFNIPQWPCPYVQGHYACSTSNWNTLGQYHDILPSVKCNKSNKFLHCTWVNIDKFIMVWHNYKSTHMHWSWQSIWWCTWPRTMCHWCQCLQLQLLSQHVCPLSLLSLILITLIACISLYQHITYLHTWHWIIHTLQNKNMIYTMCNLLILTTEN